MEKRHEGHVARPLRTSPPSVDMPTHPLDFCPTSEFHEGTGAEKDTAALWMPATAMATR